MTETGDKTWHELAEENFDLKEQVDDLMLLVNGLSRSNGELQYGRDTLATCIADVGVELGLVESEKGLTGPKLVHLMEEICDYAKQTTGSRT